MLFVAGYPQIQPVTNQVSLGEALHFFGIADEVVEEANLIGILINQYALVDAMPVADPKRPKWLD